MSRTWRNTFGKKGRHANAIPYKREPHHTTQIEIEIEITREPQRR